MEILSLILGVTVLLILVFILSVVSRVNILVKQVEQIVDVINVADEKVKDLEKNAKLQQQSEQKKG